MVSSRAVHTGLSRWLPVYWKKCVWGSGISKQTRLVLYVVTLVQFWGLQSRINWGSFMVVVTKLILIHRNLS